MLDADSALTEQLMRQLGEIGSMAHCVANAAAATAYCARNNPSIIFAPDVATCNRLADLDPQICRIVYSATMLDANGMLECVQLGVSDCLLLPLTAAQLSARIDACLQRSQALARAVDVRLQEAHDALEKDLQEGHYIQFGLLPKSPVCFGRVKLEHRLESSMLLNGDYVDYFTLRDGLTACYLADVSGHGTSAAFVTLLLKHFSTQLRQRAFDHQDLQPGEVLTWMNEELTAVGIDKHVAMFFACVDSVAGTVTFANAAQYPPALLAVDDEVTLLEQKGKPLGLFPDVQYQSLQAAFPPGARLVIFSDGVLDLVAGESLSIKEHHLAEIVQNNKDMAAIWAQLDLSQLGQDDVSCLLVANNA